MDDTRTLDLKSPACGCPTDPKTEPAVPKTSWLLPLLLLLTVLVYLPGLPGPFLFDDAPHVSKNTQVHIKDLSPSSLYQAWHSSHAKGTASRPLAQLTFGVNHALSGLDIRLFQGDQSRHTPSSTAC